jgi:hypothetical protein
MTPDRIPTKSAILFLAALSLALSACAHPMFTSWRLTNNVMVPPGIAGPTITQGTVRVDVGSRSRCPRDIQARRKQIVVTMSRDRLSSQPGGWLTTFAEDLEAQGCIAPGEAVRLANGIAQSLPLEMNAASRLLYPNDRTVVKLEPGVRLQVMTPIMVEGADPDAPLIEAATTTINGNIVNVDGRFTNNVLGYEMASYSVAARKQAPGVSISTVSAERHINGQTERVSTSIRNYFQPLSAASFYGLFYKGGQTEFTALIVGGLDKGDFDRRTNLMMSETASSCEVLNNEMCVEVPKRVAINPMVSVTVNGTEMLLNWGATVSSAIRAAGELQPNTLLPRLSIFKPYRGATAAVEFDHTDSAILNLILTGGETVSWK